MAVMNKPIIAVDIDDVLSNSSEAVRLAVNERLGTELRAEDYDIPAEYWGYYEAVWAKHKVPITWADLPEEDIKQRYLPHIGAYAVLKYLAIDYHLVAITARKENLEALTRAWLDKHFPGLIAELVIAGNHEHIVKRSKGQVCADIGAKWLIDDSVGHCVDAGEHSVVPILFGQYGWQLNIPKTMVHCKDWAAVAEYFNQQIGKAGL